MKTVMKAGRYYVGDPCYMFNDNWGVVCNAYFGEGCLGKDGNLEVFGETIFMDSTAFGDGTYADNKGRLYAVDAGVLGVVPIKLRGIDNKLKDAEIGKGLHVIDFPQDFECSCEEGIFVFGDIVIDTRQDDDRDAYEDEEDDNEYNFSEEDEDNEG